MHPSNDDHIFTLRLALIAVLTVIITVLTFMIANEAVSIYIAVKEMLLITASRAV
jgi:hypothetical protein